LVGLIGPNWGCASVTTTVVKQTIQVPAYKTDYQPAKGDDMAWAYEELWERLNAAGVRVEEIENLTYPGTDAPVSGLTFRRQKLIQVEKTYDLNGRFEVLCHEAGHLFHNSSLTQAQSEVFAELVGANLQVFYGSNKNRVAYSSSHYLAGYKYGLAMIPFIQLDLDLALKALTGKIDWHIQ
jgi:hypothetical protein